MDLVKVKNAIKSNYISNLVSEFMLDLIVVLRARITGSYTFHKEDLIVKKILEDRYKKSMKDIKYIDIGANNFRRGNNSFLFYRKCTGGGN